MSFYCDLTVYLQQEPNWIDHSVYFMGELEAILDSAQK